ncbi:MAG: hypothetical protein PHI31_03960 [Desulfuromonadaceae bacterium]|nr:hypothetical protein [Desulfuromonadaceae bacterium]
MAIEDKMPSYNVDVLIVTAVKDECDGVLRLENDWSEHLDTSGFRYYMRRDVDGIRWALARAVDMGPEHAANLATRLITLLQPRCLAMVGVCAGWREKVMLGDVIVAERLFRYDAGKRRSSRKGNKSINEVFHDIRTYSLDSRWRQKAEDFSSSWLMTIVSSRPLGFCGQEVWLLTALNEAEKGVSSHPREHPDRKLRCPDWTDVLGRLENRGFIIVDGGLRLTDEGRNYLASLRDRFPDGYPSERNYPKVSVVPMATGSQVVEDVTLFPTLQKHLRKTLAIDMEGSAVAAVAEIEEVKHCIVVKAVQDHADPDKDDRFRDYAIEVSYRFLVAFLRDQLSVSQQRTVGIVPQLEALIDNTQENKLQILDAVSSLYKSVLEQGENIAEKVTLAVNANPTPSQRYPKELVNSAIDDCLSVIRRARFIVGFNVQEQSLMLAEKIRGGEFGGGSDDVKSRALAWCARFLANGDYGTIADELISTARQLGSGPEITIAEAFRISATGKRRDALCKLADIDSPYARSAAFMIVANHNDAASSIEWLSNSGISFVNLDADGKFFLISKHLELCHWEKAYEYANAIVEEDYKLAPVLFHTVAITHLVQTIPEGFKSVDVRQMLFKASNLHLASNDDALNSRKKAQELFSKCASAAKEFGCVDAANIAEDTALWLELCDPVDHGRGLQKLQASMRDPAHSLRRLPLALQFGVKLDINAVEQEIDRQTAISGGKSQVAAMARFALVFIQRNPKAVVSYIDRHRAQLQEYLEKKSLNIIEIEMLAQSGSTQQAEERFKELSDNGLSESEKKRLQRIIAESAGADPVEARKELFESSGQIYDLINLVNLLEEQNEQVQLCHYSLLLFERTLSLIDAERLAIALNNTNQHAELKAFLEKNREFLNQSDNLQILWCWVLYRDGLLTEAASELEKLRVSRDNLSDRILTVKLAITQGDWDALQTYVESEWTNREKREADDLMKTAQLAQVIRSHRARELMYAAATKGANSAHILSSAYFLASSAGWEDDEAVAEWLQVAATLSDDSGPMKKMSIRDIVELAPDWNRRQTSAWSQLQSGSLPIFGTAHLLNRTLIDLFLLPALANPSESDPRRRSLVPAYCGVRQPQSCNYRVVAMDATALLTLGYLGLLEMACNTFEQIVIPHTTLGWLFEEKQKVTFHQPSRIRNAAKVRHLLAIGALMKFNGKAEVDSDLAAEIGEELASFLAEAQAENEGDERQKLVIRSSPVHRVGSLMDEEADLLPYYPYICSCLAVVKKLKQKGQLTAVEERRAQSYLNLNEREWPSEPIISDGAVLYLDDLSVTYLQHVGVLEKLQAGGFEVYVSSQEIKEVNSLLGYEQISSEVVRVIESVRSVLSAGIKTGNVKVGQMPQKIEANETMQLMHHPTFAVCQLSNDVEAVIVDDRFINQYRQIPDAAHTPVLTTFDLLESLHLSEAITSEQKFEYRTSLRRAGYIFVPITMDELQYYLSNTEVIAGALVETAELKAIRENLLSIRMSRFLQLPKEALWISSIIQVFSHTLKAQWSPEIDIETANARSEWLLKQLDLRGWAHCFSGEGGMNILVNGYGTQIMALLFPPSDVPLEIEEKYLAWVEEAILAKLRENDSEIYDFLVTRANELITNSVDSPFSEEPDNGI